MEVKMKKTLYYFVIFLTLIAVYQPVSSAKPIEKNSLTSKVISYPNTFLWKIEKHGIPTSYLVGTIHKNLEGYQLPLYFNDALSKTNTLMTEIKLEPNGQKLNKQELSIIANYIYEPDSNISLSAKLGTDYFTKLVQYLTKADPKWLQHVKPSAIYMLYLSSLPPEYSFHNGTDNLLAQKALKMKKKYLSLETIEDAFKIDLAIPEDKAIAAIKVFLDHQEDNQKQIIEAYNYYHQNQVNELLAKLDVAKQNLQYYSESDRIFWHHWYKNQILLERNKRWLPLIKQQIDQDSTLIAVGAAHLFGEGGLIEQLQESGYKVTPVMPY